MKFIPIITYSLSLKSCISAEIIVEIHFYIHEINQQLNSLALLLNFSIAHSSEQKDHAVNMKLLNIVTIRPKKSKSE